MPVTHDRRKIVFRPGRWHPRSPWRDPRALLGSAIFHALGLGLVVVIAASVGRPSVPLARSGPVHAELEPIDNRAPQPNSVAADNAIGSADSPPPDTDPDAGGVGAREASAAGSGIGRGGVDGGGGGTTFFQAQDDASSYVYLIDRSGSMRQYGSLELAKREVVASVNQLPETARVAVLFFNAETELLTRGLEPATAETKARITDKLRAVVADGGTRPRPALEAALALRPEVVFLLTDGQELDLDDVERLHDRAQDTRIHAIELGGRTFAHQAGERALERLARVTGGKYRHVDVRSP